MLLNEYHRAEALAREKDDAQLAALLSKTAKVRDAVSWLGIVSLLMMTAGRYLLIRFVADYAESGADRFILFGGAIGFALTVAVSSRGRRKTDRIELAMMLRRKSAGKPPEAPCCEESKQG